MAYDENELPSKKPPPLPHFNDVEFRQARTVEFAASEKLDQHLTAAIAEFSQPPESKKVMRGMQRLAFFSQNMMKSLDDKADAAADRLAAGQAKAEGVIDQYVGLATTMEKHADDALAALGQISNDPTQVSGA